MALFYFIAFFIYKIINALRMDTSEIDSLANLAVSSDQFADDSQHEHPRFFDYKNEGKVAESQRKRREEHLQRQNYAREEWLNRYRNIEKDDARNSQEEQKHRQNPFALRRKSPAADGRPNKSPNNPYANCLMHSDWLVDIPDTLSTEWTLVPSPVGRRCLVVAHKGTTSIYYRNGRFAHSFNSQLPGGSSKSSGSFAMLDCICSNRFFSKGDKFYVLDLLWWGDHMYIDMDFTVRQFFLRSKLEELKDFKNARKFLPLPFCSCSPEEITKFMEQKFPYELDGLLFYYNSAHYIPEQTPLVGWLKPWMLPEILGIKIPEKYTKNLGDVNSKKFIADYNKRHKHMSSAEIKANKETVGMEIEVDIGESKEKQADGAMMMIEALADDKKN